MPARSSRWPIPRPSFGNPNTPARNGSCPTCVRIDALAYQPPENFMKTIPAAAIAAIALFAASAPAFADQWQDIVQRKELRCATFADVPPFAAPDPKTREMVGFDVDLCTALAKQF